MSVTINASLTAGAIISSDTSGSLQLQTNSGTTALTINTSQQVGIGTTSPSNKLTIQADATGASFADNGIAQLLVEGLTDYTKRIGVGIDTTNNVGVIQAQKYGTGTYPLALNPAGGNVGIGTSSPASQLHVVANNTASAYAQTVLIQENIYPNSAYPSIAFQTWNGGNSYKSAIGGSGTDLVFYTSSTYGVTPTERARIDNSGNLCIGTTSPSTPNPGIGLAVGSNAQITIGHDVNCPTGQYFEVYKFNGSVIGGVTQNGTTQVAYNTSSDYRLKDNITPMTGALAKVAQLKPVIYKWKADNSDGQGFIAHELQEVVPECVTGEKDAVDAEGNPVYQGIDTSFLVATLTAAIQELSAELNALKLKVGG